MPATTAPIGWASTETPTLTNAMLTRCTRERDEMSAAGTRARHAGDEGTASYLYEAADRCNELARYLRRRQGR